MVEVVPNPTILYEDNHIIVAVKPAGMPSQGDISGDESILDVLKEYVRVTKEKPGEAFLGLIHRLDRPVGGVMVFARTSKAAARMSEQFRKRTVQKEYMAVVEGTPPCDEDDLRDFLSREEGRNTKVCRPGAPGAKEAVLTYRLLERHPLYSLLSVVPRTGRQHQIRVQLAAAGCPIVGDVRYNSQEGWKMVSGRSIALWAHRLTFMHPTRHEEMTFESAPPRAHPWDFFGASRGGA